MKTASPIHVLGASGFIGGEVFATLENCEGAEALVGFSRSRKSEGQLVQINTYKDIPLDGFVIFASENPNRHEVNNLSEAEFEKSQNEFKEVLEKSSKMIYLSSASVYGDAHQNPRKEVDEVFEFDNYSKLKIERESLVLDKGGIVLRLANVIGPRMSDANMLSEAISQLVSKGKVELRDLGPVRDYIDVSDVANAISKIVQRGKDITGVFNVGSGTGYSVRQIVENIVDLSGLSCDSLIGINESSDSTIILNTEKLESFISWKPQMKIRDSISNIVKVKLNG